MDVTTERSSATSSRLVDVTAFCASRYAGLDSNCLVKRSRSSGFSARPLLCPLVPIGVLHLCVRMRRSAQTGAYARCLNACFSHVCRLPEVGSENRRRSDESFRALKSLLLANRPHSRRRIPSEDAVVLEEARQIMTTQQTVQIGRTSSEIVVALRHELLRLAIQHDEL